MARPVLPWDTWNQNQNPDWWRKYQLVKHHRDQYFADANAPSDWIGNYELKDFGKRPT